MRANDFFLCFQEYVNIVPLGRGNCLSSPQREDFEEDLGNKKNVLIHVYNKTLVSSLIFTYL